MLVGVACAAPFSIAPSSVSVTIDASHIHAHTWPEFASFNMDAALFGANTNLSNSR